MRTERLVVPCIRAGMKLKAAITGESVGGRQRPGELQALQHYVHVAWVGKVIGPDRRCVQRIAGAQSDFSPAVRMEQRWTKCECMAFTLLEPMLHKIADAKMELQIRHLAASGSLDEPARLRDIRGQRPILETHITQQIRQALSTSEAD